MGLKYNKHIGNEWVGVFSLLLFSMFLLSESSFAQTKRLLNDSIKKVAKPLPIYLTDSADIADSARRHQIRKTTRSAMMVPGWGQIRNEQAWKVPLVYAALGIPAYLFFSNLEEYRGLRQAYIYKVDTIVANDALIPERYKPLTANSLRFYRDEFRRNIDYSVLAFIGAWGLQIIDAAVFANLKGFDVSDDLSLRPHVPQYNPLLKTGTVSVSLVFQAKAKLLKPLPGTR